MLTNFQVATFIKSASRLTECPPDSGREVAFCGRSNAGKSSAINTLTRHTGLARVSKTPGRTQLINFFELQNNRRLVDLPGYGYARVPISVKQHWHTHLDHYLRERTSLSGLVLLMDIRHPLKEFDVTLLTWCAEANLPLHVLLTKADKLKRGAQKNTLLSLKRDLPNQFSVQLFSSLHKTGLDELEAKLSLWLQEPAASESTELSDCQ